MKYIYGSIYLFASINKFHNLHFPKQRNAKSMREMILEVEDVYKYVCVCFLNILILFLLNIFSHYQIISSRLPLIQKSAEKLSARP